jgi:hypothetical protein
MGTTAFMRRFVPLLLTLLAAGATVGVPPGAADTAAPITISPAAGTPDASPQTQISILGLARRDIHSVQVTGSTSGHHAGRLRGYSGARGASFVLSKPLDQGERVRVKIWITKRAPIAFSFSVARLASTPPILAPNERQPKKLDHFISAPTVLAPTIRVLKPAPHLRGDILLTPLPSPEVHPGSKNELTIHPVGPGGPMIIDGQGRLVWFRPLRRPNVAADLRLQRFDGHRVLTWWQGQVSIAAFGLGEGVIAGTSYRTIKIVHAGNGYGMDLHEFELTPDGDALFTAYSPVLVHLAGTPAGKLSTVLDAIVQEVDVRTGLVVWEWHSLGHIPLADSYATPQNSIDYDAYHLNSIQLLSHNRVLLSARDTSAVYEVNRSTGRVIWTLGGKASSFHLASGARFYFQHDARMRPGQRVSLFDDEAGPPEEASSSRGLVLHLDMRHHVARVVDEYRRPGNDTLADSEGSLQPLAGGTWFVGFGSEPYFSEFSAAGHLLFDAKLPTDDGSYRMVRAPWSGLPKTRPSVVVQRHGTGWVRVYVSWNGATHVARWQVLAGGPHGHLAPVTTAPDRGFQTRIAVHSGAVRFAVRALGSGGQPLQRSDVVTAS